ncbi:hypothetical protein FRC20_006975 [Serendipita sp. 405]|nr:hypothetical protein FRC16_007516 [Serendipita sp. 398]KAG8831423.1 hypothetical protein FRC18_006553 [Serendipita sp. 400]KAG8836661.1 hypothetical protein FRC20_006975 [Serendipita sp. 405]
MRHQYTWGFVLALALAHVEGLPVKNLYKRREGEIKIYDHDGHEHTYQISQKATGGVSQAIHTIPGDPAHLAKGPVTLLEAMITRWYTPETVIGSETPSAAAAGERNLEPNYLKGVDATAKKVHMSSPIQSEGHHKGLKGKTTPMTLEDGTTKTVHEWWMIMPIVGAPIRELPTIKATLEAEGKPDKEKLIAECKTFVEKHLVPEVRNALDEWYDIIHKLSGHWFRFGDIKPSHFRWLNKDTPTPHAKMIDFGTARINTVNKKPKDEFEKINARDWLNFCTPGYEDKSNTPSIKTASQKSGSQKSGHGGHEVPESSAAGANHPHPAVVEQPGSHPIPIPAPQQNTGGATGSGGSGGSSPCGCIGKICKC